MPSAPCRDLTSEFYDCAQELDRSKAVGGARRRPTDASLFARSAQTIFQNIYSTHDKLRKLAKLATSTSLFDDPVLDIQELSYIIKKDIEKLNRSLEALKSVSNTTNRQSRENSDRVLESLQFSLASTTQEFQQVLQTRSENYQKQQASRKQFIGDHSMSQRQSILYQPELENEDGMGGMGGGGEQSQALVQQPSLAYNSQARLEAVQQIESTMVELNSIMMEVSTMVAEQGEVVERISRDIDDANEHVLGAQEQLLKYLSSVSSNRGLILKMLFVLVIFIIIFFVFFV